MAAPNGLGYGTGRSSGLMRKSIVSILTALSLAIGGIGAASALELSEGVSYLYTSVSVFPAVKR